MLERATRMPHLRLATICVAVSIFGVAFGSSSAAASAAIPVCGNPNGPDQVAAQAPRDSSSVSCQTQHFACPDAAAYCQFTLDGEVGAFPASLVEVGVKASNLSGTFEVFGHVEPVWLTAPPVASKVIGSDECSIDGELFTKVVCARRVQGSTSSYDGIAAVCSGTAARPAVAVVDFCRLTVTPVFLSKRCRKKLAADQRARGDSATPASAARASCRARKGRPVRPLKNPPPSRPIKPPPLPKQPDCSQDDPNAPPSPGCVRVTVRVIPAPLPSDPGNESIGVGVGTATLEPGGKTIQCLNPQDAETCVLTTDVPANTQASVSAQPGSLTEDPSSPPDSAFWKFDGACTGTGTCTFTPASGATVDVYFIPAMVTLTLQASGDGGHANMTANEFKGGGLEPAPPVYCGYTYPANPLPCRVMVRVEKFAQVEANTAGDPNIVLDGFSSNCTPEGPGSSFCDLRMTSDQTVTATFGAGGLA